MSDQKAFKKLWEESCYKEQQDRKPGATQAEIDTNVEMIISEGLKSLASRPSYEPGADTASKVLSALSPAKEELQLRAIRHFVWCMAEFGDYRQAITESCDFAGLQPPVGPRSLHPIATTKRLASGTGGWFKRNFKRIIVAIMAFAVIFAVVSSCSPSVSKEAANEMAMSKEFTRQLEAAKVDPVAFRNECERAKITTVCSVVMGNSTSIGDLQSDVEALKEGQNALWGALVQNGQAAVPAETNTKTAGEELASSLAPMGFTEGQVVLGNKIDWSKNPADPGTYPFANKPLKSQADSIRWLKSPDPGAKKSVEMIKAGTPESLHSYFTSGKGLTPVQFLTSTCVDGNTYMKGHKVLRGDQVCHKAGDIWLVPVAPDGTVYWAAAVRVDCGNVGVWNPPYPTTKKSLRVCAEGTDHPGRALAKGCYDKQRQPKSTEKKSTPKASQPPAKTHTPSTTPTKATPTPKPTPTPTRTTPTRKVPVCTAAGQIKWVPADQAHKYPKKPVKGLCKDSGPNRGLNGTDGAAPVNRNDGATDSRGLQTNPSADADAAKKKAAADAAAKKAAADKAAAEARQHGTDSGGGPSDYGPVVPSSTPSSTGSAGEDTTGMW